jgi:hypothetical protein
LLKLHSQLQTDIRYFKTLSNNWGNVFIDYALRFHTNTFEGRGNEKHLYGNHFFLWQICFFPKFKVSKWRMILRYIMIRERGFITDLLQHKETKLYIYVFNVFDNRLFLYWCFLNAIKCVILVIDKHFCYTYCLYIRNMEPSCRH